MELEHHQLDLRYEALRCRAPEREKRLLVSLAEHGQQMPIVVVGDGAHVVVDGFKRVRALKQLKSDIVLATAWDLDEADALVFERLMRVGEGDGALEQGWLLRELEVRFGQSQEELARRFDKSVSWVSRRLSLVKELPEAIQERVRQGELAPYSAMKYLVPLARANRKACVQLVASLGKSRPSSRQLGMLYAAWLSGNAKSRELLLSDPWLFLRAQEEVQRARKEEKPPAQTFLSDLGALGAISRRACMRLRQGLWGQVLAPERDEIARCAAQARSDTDCLFALFEKELRDARPESAHGHS
ncbi:MAG TPA: ParB N-terminal domain-containing protein [Candidatus Acidoferrales bacterium]|nr:ParB N-terminal domain-containing protein [Candidatus Acidoferrales bacterium]